METTPEDRQANKLALVKLTNELMPAGKPAFLEVIKYPMVKDLVQYKGEPVTLLLISIMVKDFCASFNVQRNMNEDQILEAAAMLLNECGNFRLEDYAMMFAMAKRGQLIKVYERIDLSFIAAILDAYWQLRRESAQKAQDEESNTLEALGPVIHAMDGKSKQEAKMLGMFDGFGGAIGDLKTALKDSNNGRSGTLDPGTV